MQIKDDRTETQKLTHRYLIVGTDSFLSRWAPGGGASYAAWACETSEEVDQCMKAVEDRSDMKRVRFVIENPTQGYVYRPKASLCNHLHIYVWEKGQIGFFS